MRNRRRVVQQLAVGLVSAAVGATLLAVKPHSLADLRSPSDLERALVMLGSDVPERRARAADWLALHGTVERAVPALVAAISRERAPEAMASMGLALARRARPEDARALIELEGTLRAPARAPLMVALAQLATDESDAWLVGRLRDGAPADLDSALQQLAEIARVRRDAVLGRVLAALEADGPSLALLEWLVSLRDERARGALLDAVRRRAPSRDVALFGLAELGPNSDTALALAELLHDGEEPSPLLVGALVAANPQGPIDGWLDRARPELRRAALQALVRWAPARALALVGEDPRAIAGEDHHVLDVAVEHPSPPLVPWLLARAADAGAWEESRREALDALIGLPACAVSLDRVDPAERPIAEARLARRCPGRAAPIAGESGEALHLRAIAGHDVRDRLRERYDSAGPADRLALAHAWLSGTRGDPTLARRLAAEREPDVFAVLAVAASVHAVSVPPDVVERALEDPRLRLPALWLAERLLGASAVDPGRPALARAVARARRDRDDVVRAASMRLGGASAFACAGLESPLTPVRRAALFALVPTHPCVVSRARVDPDVRAALAGGCRVSHDALTVVRVRSAEDRLLPRVSVASNDGRWFVLRPPLHGIVAIPGIASADVGLVLDSEPSPAPAEDVTWRSR